MLVDIQLNVFVLKIFNIVKNCGVFLSFLLGKCTFFFQSTAKLAGICLRYYRNDEDIEFCMSRCLVAELVQLWCLHKFVCLSSDNISSS